MPHIDPVFRALCRGQPPWRQAELIAARQGRGIHVRQLTDCGLSVQQVRTATARGHLHRVHRGVRVFGTQRLTDVERRWVAFLAVGEDGAFAGGSGSAIAGLRPITRGPLELVTPTRRRGHCGVAVTYLSGLTPAWVERRDGLPVLKAPHLLLDLAATLSAEALAIAMNQALSLRRARLEEIAAVVAARPAHAGSAALAQALAEATDDPGTGRTHGELEELVLVLLRGTPGLPPFVRNAPVELAGGRIASADILFTEPRVMVELDSRNWHEQRLAMDSDRRRDHQAMAVGLLPFRITWRHAVREWPAVSADLTALLAVRAGA
jgi:hypothetical protein